MQPLRLTLVSASLRLADLRLDASKEPAGREPLAGRGHRSVLQTEVDANAFSVRRHVLYLDANGQAQPPVPDRVLRDATVTPFDPLQTFRFEHPDRLAAEPETPPFALQARGLERDPAEGAPGAARLAPGQPYALGCSPLDRLLAADSLDGIRADAFEILRGAGREIAQIEAGEEFRARTSIAIRGIDAGRIRPVPHLVDLDRGRGEPGIGLRLHFQTQREDTVRGHDSILSPPHYRRSF